MPYVRVLLSRGARNERLVRRLETDLRGFIAGALAVPASAKFSSDEVTIDGVFLCNQVDQPGNVQPPQHAQVDVAIVIFSNANPERISAANLIAQQILDGVKNFLPDNLNAWVYLPTIGGFAQT